MPKSADMPVLERPQNGRSRTVQMINLGCAKNVVDSEEMLGELSRNGYSIESRRSDADVVVINTCAFIESAKQESIDVILQALERKKRGDVRKVVVAGCLAQRYSADLAAELPEVDAFLGTGQMGRIAQVVGDTLVRPGQLLQVEEKPHHRWVDLSTRIRSTAPWTAYLKISEGCDHKCTFCAIPSFRGAHVSKPMDRIVDEARSLASQGVRELNLIAQDSTQYGYDLYGKPMLPALLRELSQVVEVRWLRLFYCYPSRVNDAVIAAIAETQKVCQYIDMPLQHADDDVLRAMSRPRNGGRYLEIVRKFREASPDVAIRTTFIVGFPGETDAQFDNLLRFVEEAQFDRVGVFEYSTEDGTPSAALPGRVPARIKRERKDRLMRLQQRISLERNQGWVGREMEVMVESAGVSRPLAVGNTPHRPTPDAQHSTLNTQHSTLNAQNSTLNTQRSTLSGRTFRDAPEIDGLVYVSGRDAAPGEFITARITRADTYDLFAE